MTAGLQHYSICQISSAIVIVILECLKLRNMSRISLAATPAFRYSRDMRALITGINGFVGGHLAEQLLSEHEWELWGLARQPTLALPQLRNRVNIVSADLNQLNQVTEALDTVRPEIIFHLAGQANVPRSFADPAGTLQTNIFAELHLFQALMQLKLDARILIACSNEIYGHVAPEFMPLNEQTLLRPVSPYAVSKATQDLLAYQYYISYGLKTIRMRLFNHIGPRQTDAYVASAFAAQIARIELGQQEPIMRVGNLDAERDFSDVRDIVRAYSLAARHAQVGEAYNVGSGTAIPVRRLLEILLSHSTTSIVVQPDPARMRPADVPLVVCDNSLFRAHTGWVPEIPLEQTLLDILNDWRARTQKAAGNVKF